MTQQAGVCEDNRHDLHAEPLDEFDQFLAQSRGRLNLDGRGYGLPSPVPVGKRYRRYHSQEVVRTPPATTDRKHARCPSCSCVAAMGSVTEIGTETTVEGEGEGSDTFSEGGHSLPGMGEEWNIGEPRPRARTMPTRNLYSGVRPPRLTQYRSRNEDLMHRVRAFHLTSKGGLVKEGDTFVSSTGTSKANSSESVGREGKTLRVLLQGESGVGKRALIRELIDPTCSNHPFNSLDDDGDRCVSILLDGEESTLEFVEITDNQVDECTCTEPIDAHVVVYSVEDRDSFHAALDRLVDIRKDWGRHVALILVANKTDLVRTRIIMSEEGKSAAKTHDCKYIEVSAAIDHKIDELLVGILKQIRLIRSQREKARQKVRGYSMDERCCLLQARQNVLARIFKGDGTTTKSCDNLYVL